MDSNQISFLIPLHPLNLIYYYSLTWFCSYKIFTSTTTFYIWHSIQESCHFIRSKTNTLATDNQKTITSRWKSSVMEVRRMNMNLSSHERSTNGSKTVVHHQGRQMGSDYDNRSLSNNNNYGGQRMVMISKPKSRSSYFSLESMVVLVGLAASLLILPLILPPLPPPPFMLLLLPLCIFAVLMVFAIMPSSSSSSSTAARHKSERSNQ